MIKAYKSRDRLEVRTLRCGRNNPGSNPGHGTFFFLLLVLPEICVHILNSSYVIGKTKLSSGVLNSKIKNSALSGLFFHTLSHLLTQ